jgi:hypothetical protein
MKFTLSIESESPGNISLIADIAEMVEKEGLLSVDPHAISSLLLVLHDGLSTKRRDGEFPYIIGSGSETDLEEWDITANLLEACTIKIREIITERMR